MVQQWDLNAPHLVEPDLDMRRLNPVSPPPPMAQMVASDLRVKLLEGSWQYEQTLPNERELSATYEVSRPTIREALRTLQNEGLIEIQRGKAGGAVVRFPSERTVEDLCEALDQHLTAIVDMIDARRALEPWFARQAASKRTPEHLKALEESVQRIKDAAEVLQNTDKLIADENLLPQVKQSIKKERERARLDYKHADSRLHLTVSVAARNSNLLEMFTNLRTKFFTFPGIDLLIEHDESRRTQVIKQHEKIVRAIEKHDKKAAEDAMREHIECTKKALSSFLETELEKQLVNRHELAKHLVNEHEDPREAAATAVRMVLLETKVFALLRNGSADAEDTAEDDGVFHFISDGPNGEEQIMVPVFTRRAFIQDAMYRYPDWQGLAQSVLELEGRELLAKLDPLSELDPDARVVINPWTPLEFRIPVAPIQTDKPAATTA